MTEQERTRLLLEFAKAALAGYAAGQFSENPALIADMAMRAAHFMMEELEQRIKSPGRPRSSALSD